MATKNWIITDIQAGTHLDELLIHPSDVGGEAQGYSISKRRLHGGLSDGVDTLRIDNGRLAFEVLPTRGMSLWKAWIDGHAVGWQSPIRGPVHPHFVPLTEPSGIGWLDGFDELLVRCGLESNGAPDFDEQGRLQYPLHGRIGNKPAQRVEVAIDGASGEIRVTGVVEETRFHFSKLRLTTTLVTRLGEPSLWIHDEVENLSASPADMQLLYHINFGLPMLDAGSQVVAPAKTVVPRNDHAASGIGSWQHYAAEAAGFEEQVYFLEMLSGADGATHTLLKNAHGTRGASLLFNTQQLPYFSLWKNTTAAADGYVTGLEPGTNFPNPRSFEKSHNRVVTLAPGGKANFDIQLQLHASAEDVDHAERQVNRLRGETKPQIYDAPRDDWCA